MMVCFQRCGIPKGPSQDSELPKVRPICLLDEIGKIFERVIATRIKVWMDENPHAQLSEHQFGFREGVSTSHVLMKALSIITEANKDGDVAIAISLDIANAFNTLVAVYKKGIE